MFKFLLSPEARDRLDKQHRVLHQLYSTDDRLLAEGLLRACRQVRADNPRVLPIDHTYEASFLWHLVPEIARRLGAKHFESNERADAKIVMYNAMDLRFHTGLAIGNTSARHLGNSESATLLLNEPCNGNPVAFALDRLPPLDLALSDDIIARGIREIARIRGVETDGRWSPAMDVPVRLSASAI